MSLFTIIVTAHNDEADIRRCIMSVLNQSCNDYELIVTLDRSTDRTGEIIRQIGIKPILTDYGCPGLPRNVALEKATGEYVFFLDGDDHLLHPEVLRMLYDIINFQKNKGVVLDLINFGFIWKKYGYMDTMGNNNGWFPNVWSRLWRREAIADTRFGDEFPGEDLNFMNEMMEKELMYISWDVPMVFYNNPREGSVTSGSI